MSNGIAQFNIQFDAVEDRLQLRVLSTNDEEIRVWLTRRYVRLLLKALQDKCAALPATKGLEIVPPGERFSDPYMGNDETHLPLGTAPQLVSRIALQDKPDGNLGLLLGQEHEGGVQVELGLNRELLESLQAMLVEAAKTAEWDLGDETQVEEFTEHLSGVVLH